jgi:hypothetical protein
MFLFQKCLGKFDLNNNKEYKSSRYNHFRKITKSLLNEERLSPSLIAKRILNSLDSNAFDIKVYKVVFLLSFYYVESNIVDKRIRDALPSIKVVVDSNKDVFINSELNVRWMPIAILRQDSIGKAVAIVKKGPMGLVENERNFKEGGILPEKDDELYQLIKQTTVLVDGSFDDFAAPAILWFKDGQMMGKIGVPDEDELLNILNYIKK